MKRILLIGLSACALALNASYLIYDHQFRDHQEAQLADSFRQRINAADEKAENSYQGINAQIAQLRDSILGKQASIASTINLMQETQQKMQETQQKNETLLAAVRHQSDVTASTVTELKNDALAQLQETETELVLLKKEQLAKDNEVDNHWRKVNRHIPEGALTN